MLETAVYRFVQKAGRIDRTGGSVTVKIARVFCIEPRSATLIVRQLVRIGLLNYEMRPDRPKAYQWVKVKPPSLSQLRRLSYPEYSVDYVFYAAIAVDLHGVKPDADHATVKRALGECFPGIHEAGLDYDALARRVMRELRCN